MEIETREYEFAHGKKPRGFGNWAFIFDGQRETPFFQLGKYSDACRMARAYAVARNFRRIEVGS